MPRLAPTSILGRPSIATPLRHKQFLPCCRAGALVAFPLGGPERVDEAPFSGCTRVVLVVGHDDRKLVKERVGEEVGSWKMRNLLVRLIVSH